MDDELFKWVDSRGDITFPMLQAIWTMRWNKDKTAMCAVLTPDEANQICKDIITKLDEAGYKIVKKEDCQSG